MTQAESKVVNDLLLEKLWVDACWDRYHESLTGVVVRPLSGIDCPKCGDQKGQWRGYRERQHGGTLHRRWCRSCGRWFCVSASELNWGCRD
jgi:hypothetical protein